MLKEVKPQPTATRAPINLDGFVSDRAHVCAALWALKHVTSEEEFVLGPKLGTAGRI